MSEHPHDPTEALQGRPSGTITLAELDSLFGLTVRAMNVCLVNNLTSLEAIARAQRSFRGLAALKNCGKKTVMELEDLLAAATRRMGPLLPVLPSSGVVSSLGMEPVDRAGMLAMIEGRLPLLSVRARNALSNFLEEDTPEAILDGILLSGFDLRKLRNVGSKTIAELREFGRSVFEQRPAPGVVGVPETTATTVFLALKNHFDREEIQLIRQFILQDDPSLPSILELVKLIVDVWSKRAGTRWSSISAYVQSTAGYGALARAGGHSGLTRERMRQLFLKWDREFEARFAFLNDLPGPFKPEPAMPHGRATILTRDIADGINARLGSDWGQPFIARILVLASNKNYRVVSWRELWMPGKKARDFDSQSPVLIRSDSVAAVIAMAQHFRSVLAGTRTTDSVHRFEAIALPLGVEWNEELTNAMRPLLVACEPGIRFDGDLIHLPPNKRRRREELIAEVLEELKTPTHVTVLVERLQAIDPNREWTTEYVRSTIVRFKDRFISLSRTSTYGLRKWEDDREGIKGGTIRSMVEHLLREAETPLHVDHLAEHIRRFRPTTSASSIRLNLQLDTDPRFTFIHGGFIGLRDRNYERMPEPLKRVPGSLMRGSVMRKFIGQPLVRFIEHLSANCDAHPDQVERTIRSAIDEGRLVVNEVGCITAVAAIGPLVDGSLSPNGELPLDW